MKIRMNTVLLGILTLIALGAVLHVMQLVFLPLVIAVLLSFILTPLVTHFNKKISRTLAVLLVIIILIVVLYVIGWFFYTSITSFISVIGYYQDRFSIIINELVLRYNLPDDILELMEISGSLRTGVYNISISFVNFAGQLIIVLFFVVFMLLENPLSERKMKMAFPKLSVQTRLSAIIKKITSQIARYLTVKLGISAATGALVALCLYFIGLDFYLMWGFLAILFNFIPNIGSTVIMIATILMSFIQFYPEWNPILATLITMPLIQMIFGNFLDPKLQGNQLDLSPVIILVSLVFWGWIWGIPGMFLAVPLAEAIKIICANIETLEPVSILMSSGKALNTRRRKKKNNPETDNAEPESSELPVDSENKEK
ncbi:MULTISPECIES: AI-2E family transporter [unclassified Oceanispirochaeta]|nr:MULTISPECIES: AI-2E family transporter [unclassified Oceanispirochaeta]MBF9018070.1 AI-2E family transporter [Oceanispirochaeta sp. M2]NPD73849.1 AI-2E family transporter [Oceanispirochaeta sp. M1]RDG30311.1 AI-2E family transporter [Oceanispirochaeta sp. M1]